LWEEVDPYHARCSAWRLLGVTASQNDTPDGHYIASRYFGPVQYRAVAIPQAARNDRNEEAE
jgi:hypothetical protein